MMTDLYGKSVDEPDVPCGEYHTKSSDGRWFLEWEDIGEGFDGDFDPDNPEDRPLWRATMVDKNGDPLDDGSYCTQAVVGIATTDDLEQMAEDLFSCLGSGPFRRGEMERWTWRTRRGS